MKRYFLLLFVIMLSPVLSAGEFHKVVKGSDEFSFVEKYFQSVIEPLYGDQSQALSKIAASKDRTCELLFKGSGGPLGILVYKNFPVQEFEPLGVQNVLEIKTLFVVNAGKNSGRGIGSQLMERIVAVAKSLLCSNIVVTVSEEKKDALAFFLKKGFFVTHTMRDKYKNGVDEYVLVRNL